MTHLPFTDGAFTIVVTRFAVHHFLDAAGGVRRDDTGLSAPGGRIVIVDMYASEDDAKAAQWNRLELLRDPSHVRCLPLSELKALFGKVGLEQPAESFYGVHDSVKNLLGRSFPNPGDDAKITAMFAASVKDDSLGIPATLRSRRTLVHLSDRDPFGRTAVGEARAPFGRRKAVPRVTALAFGRGPRAQKCAVRYYHYSFRSLVSPLGHEPPRHLADWRQKDP